MTLEELCQRSFDMAESKGFHKPNPNFYERMMLVVSECSEAIEGHRKGQPFDRNVSESGAKPEGIPSEIADILIRLGDVIKQFGIAPEGISAIIEEKMTYNSTRPYMHGKNA